MKTLVFAKSRRYGQETSRSDRIASEDTQGRTDVDEGVSGRLQCNVRAHPLTIIAFMMSKDCDRFAYLERVRESTMIDFRIIAEANPHNKIMIMSLPNRRDSILFVCETVWTRFEHRTDKWVLTMTVRLYWSERSANFNIINTKPLQPDYFTAVAEEEDEGRTHTVVRGGLSVTMILHLLADGSTLVDTVFNVLIDDSSMKPNKIYGFAVREFGMR